MREAFQIIVGTTLLPVVFFMCFFLPLISTFFPGTVENTTLTCERSKNVCRLVQRTLLNSKSQKLLIGDLKGASVDVVPLGDDGVTLLTSQGEIPVDGWGLGCYEKVEKINTFVKESRYEYLYVEDFNWTLDTKR